MDTAHLYADKDIVVRREGNFYRVLRSRFHAKDDLITKSVLDDVSSRTTPNKIVILPPFPPEAA